MAIFIIDNKKINLTQDEWELYQNIVKSYTTSTNKGEDLFIDLFESNDDGIIIFLKPPSKRQISFEIFLFLISVFSHQHIRVVHSEVFDICNQMNEKLKEIDEKMKILDQKIKDCKKNI